MHPSIQPEESAAAWKDNTAYVRSKGVMLSSKVPKANRTAIGLSYTHTEANKLREFIAPIKLRGTKAPPLALIFRRAINFWMQYVDAHPDALEAETRALNEMVCKVPKPAFSSKLKKRPPATSPPQTLESESQ